MTRITLPVFLIILMAGAVGWLHFGSSGTFVSHGQNFTALLKIERASNNQIVGLYQQITLRPDGKISNDTAVVSGISQLTKMTLNLKQQPFSMDGIVMADFDGINLTLTSVSFRGLPNVQIFTRSSIPEFDQYAAQLQNKANAIAAEKQRVELEQKATKQKNEFINEINSLILRMSKSSPELDNVTSQAPNIEKKYSTISEKMESVLERERALADNPQTFQTRIEMANSLYDGTYKTDQIHFDTLNAENQFKANILPNSQYAAKLKQSCNSYFGDDIEVACQKLNEATQTYNTKVFAVGNALSHLEKSYSSEMAQQKAIIREANSLNHN